jgi:hypothetical protein
MCCETGQSEDLELWRVATVLGFLEERVGEGGRLWRSIGEVEGRLGRLSQKSKLCDYTRLYEDGEGGFLGDFWIVL